MAGSGASEVLGDAGRSARTVGRVLRVRLPGLLVGVAVLVTALCVVAFAGAVTDDLAIDRDRGTASAEVLDGSGFARTLVRFPVPDGKLLVPERGVYYPRGLQPGTTVQVEYARAEPDLVRVAGRSAGVGVLPLLGGIAVGWLLFGGAAYLVRRRRQDHQDQGAHQE